MLWLLPISAGIVHRDIKPANIIVTRKGLVKVLDFGLAKLAERALSESSETATAALGDAAAAPGVTIDGTIVGTVAYMSPEQALGRTLDGRSDIFSFGTVLYEMTTGRRAFSGDTNISTLAAILSQEPKPARELCQTCLARWNGLSDSACARTRNGVSSIWKTSKSLSTRLKTNRIQVCWQRRYPPMFGTLIYRCRRIRLSQRKMRLQFRAEFFNFFNNSAL